MPIRSHVHAYRRSLWSSPLSDPSGFGKIVHSTTETGVPKKSWNGHYHTIMPHGALGCGPAAP